jgi:hypothetical protein
MVAIQVAEDARDGGMTFERSSLSGAARRMQLLAQSNRKAVLAFAIHFHSSFFLFIPQRDYFQVITTSSDGLRGFKTQLVDGQVPRRVGRFVSMTPCGTAFSRRIKDRGAW